MAPPVGDNYRRMLRACNLSYILFVALQGLLIELYLANFITMRSLLDRLQGLSPVIAEICRILGPPGASIGVLHHGEIIYTHNHGYRNVEARIPPDEETIYHIASLSKSCTAAAIGILVEEGKMKWDRQILPDLSM